MTGAPLFTGSIFDNQLLKCIKFLYALYNPSISWYNVCVCSDKREMLHTAQQTVQPEMYRAGCT